MTYKDPHSEFNKTLQNIFLIFVKFFSKIKFISYYFISLGLSFNLIKIAKLYNYINNFNKPIYSGLRRESLWKLIISKIEKKEFEPTIILEFGVAWGYMTNFFLKRTENYNFKWYGFDSFLGLPDNWESYKKGHFSTDGKPPSIDDPRLKWIIGNVEETCLNMIDSQTLFKEQKKLIIFDLDMFEPTEFVLKTISSHLNNGDIIYFDEPNHLDELAILHRLMKKNPGGLEVIMYTPCQIALEVKKNLVKY